VPGVFRGRQAESNTEPEDRSAEPEQLEEHPPLAKTRRHSDFLNSHSGTFRGRDEVRSNPLVTQHGRFLKCPRGTYYTAAHAGFRRRSHVCRRNYKHVPND
jgi:hypothetical protein